MNFTYTQGWFIAHKKPLKILNMEFAKAQHLNKKPYTVLVGDDPQRPTLFLNINFSTGFIGAYFLDTFLRIFLEYSFTLQDGRFFLGRTFQRFFEDSSDRVLRTEAHHFTPEGHLTIYLHDIVSNDLVTRTANEKADVKKNWEDVPQFGEYQSFTTIER